ncbi:hypothetical protein L596_012584 [Steinernema carpocapsae]|uniref:G-protein coupled receptors family 1 profile domain-containing protein n=1 Tax=Steinernema carpocapsae TaxID=34508 RepID=A0A4U5NXQ9_STECR|nr:hypothetical protein L596_012584 [Steinernema carpocapsae]
MDVNGLAVNNVTLSSEFMPNLEEIYGHCLTLNTLFSFIVTLPTMYIVNAKTLRHYANCILNILVWNLILNIFVSSFYRVVPLYPAFCYKNNGILRYFAANDAAGFYSIMVLFACYFNITAAIAVLQVFRFLQTVCKKSVENINVKLGYSCVVIVHFFATVIAILVCQHTRAPPSMYQEIFKYNPYFVEELSDPTVICFVTQDVKILNLVCFGITLLIVSATTGLQFISLKHLEKQKTSLTSQAYNQQRRLTIHLLAIVLVPILVGGLPFELQFGTLMFNNSYVQVIAVVLSGIALLHHNIFCIFVLCLFKSYRFATKALLYKMMQMNPTVTVSSSSGIVEERRQSAFVNAAARIDVHI